MIPTVKLYDVFLLVLILSVGCKEKHTQGELTQTYQVVLNSSELHQNHIEIFQNHNNPKTGDSTIQKKDLVTSVIDTSNIKSCQIEFEHFTKNLSSDNVVLGKAILDIEFRKVNIKGVEHWFAVNCNGKGFARNRQVSFQISPYFFYSGKYDKLTALLQVQFIWGERGFYSKSTREGDARATSVSGRMTTEDVFIQIVSESGKLKIYPSNRPLNKVYEYPEFDTNSLEHKILKKIFNTDKKLQRRMQITLK